MLHSYLHTYSLTWLLTYFIDASAVRNDVPVGRFFIGMPFSAVPMQFHHCFTCVVHSYSETASRLHGLDAVKESICWAGKQASGTGNSALPTRQIRHKASRAQAAVHFAGHGTSRGIQNSGVFTFTSNSALLAMVGIWSRWILMISDLFYMRIEKSKT